jgi:hypothetical protein
LQRKIISKIGRIYNDESYASYKLSRDLKRKAKKIAIDSLKELNYSNPEINTIVNEYWPKQFIKIKHRFQLNYTNIEMVRHQYPTKKYKKYIMQRYYLALSALEQQLIDLNFSGQG